MKIHQIKRNGKSNTNKKAYEKKILKQTTKRGRKNFVKFIKECELKLREGKNVHIQSFNVNK